MILTSGNLRPSLVPKIKCAFILIKFGTVNNKNTLNSNDANKFFFF